MIPNLHDITGQRFGRWVVLRYDADEYYVCRCDCGTERNVNGYSLRRGRSTSCGCATYRGPSRASPMNSPLWAEPATKLVEALPLTTREAIRWCRDRLGFNGEIARHLLAYGDTVHWWLHTDGKWRCEQELREELACVSAEDYWSSMEAAE